MLLGYRFPHCFQSASASRDMTVRFDIYDLIMLAGVALLALGVCLPVVYLPILGPVSYLAGGKGDGVIVLILACIICGLVIFKFRLIGGVVGLAVAGVMLNTFVKLASEIHDVGAAAKLPAGNPFAGLVTALANTAGLGFGWLPLFLGVTLVIGGAFVPLAQPKKLSEAPASEFDADAIVKKYLDEEHAPSLHGATPHQSSASNLTPAAHQAKAFGRRAGLR
jgi:hypothetical protein